MGQGTSASRSIATDQAGQSVVQILVSIVLMGILMAAFATMMTNQWRETRALVEKLAAADVQKLLTASLADGSVCQYVLNNPTVLTFDSTKVSPATPQIINLTNPTAATAALYTSMISNPAAPPALLPGPVAVEVNQTASALSSNLIVKSIQLQIDKGAGGSFSGNWIVAFDSSTLVRPIRPVSVSTILTVDVTNPSAAKITGCQSSSMGGGVPVSVSVWGSGKRCKNDKAAFVCGDNPGYDWNFNYCESMGHFATYNEEARWDAAGQGYALVFKTCAAGTICPAWGINPFKLDVVCLEGLQ